MSESRSRQGKNNKIQLLLIFLIFFGPLVLAALYFNYSKQWLTMTTNKGALLSPTIQLTDFHFTNSAKQIVRPKVFNKRWTVLFVNNNECDTGCQQRLWIIRQVRLALGNDKLRVNRYYLNSAPTIATQLVKFIAKQHEGMGVVTIDKTNTLRQQAVYIADPHGQIILEYNNLTEPDDLYKDLKRLLKASRIG